MDPGRCGGLDPPLHLHGIDPGAVAIGNDPRHLEAQASIEALGVLAGAERDALDRGIRFGLAQACQRQFPAQSMPVQRALYHAPAETGTAVAASRQAAAGHDAAISFDDLECTVHGLFLQEAFEVAAFFRREECGYVAVEDRQAGAGIGGAVEAEVHGKCLGVARAHFNRPDVVLLKGVSHDEAAGAPKCSKVHGAESIFSRMISPTSNDCAEHRRLHQAGASVAGSGEADAGAMACSGARRLLGYALDTWD